MLLTERMLRNNLQLFFNTRNAGAYQRNLGWSFVRRSWCARVCTRDRQPSAQTALDLYCDMWATNHRTHVHAGYWYGAYAYAIEYDIEKLCGKLDTHFQWMVISIEHMGWKVLRINNIPSTAIINIQSFQICSNIVIPFLLKPNLNPTITTCDTEHCPGYRAQYGHASCDFCIQTHQLHHVAIASDVQAFINTKKFGGIIPPSCLTIWHWNVR